MIDMHTIKEKTKSIIIRTLQWCVAIYFMLVILMHLIPANQIHYSSSFLVPLLLSLAVAITLFCLHLPPVFFRLPGWLKITAYFGLLFPGVAVVGLFTPIQAAYEQTPKGKARKAKEDADRIVEERLRAERNAINARTQQIEEDRNAQDRREKAVKSCLSWGGRFSPLENEVKSSLHNPASFEHVKTQTLTPPYGRYNMEMTYRAENGFGAIRTNQIMAEVDPDSCDLLHVDGL